MTAQSRPSAVVTDFLSRAIPVVAVYSYFAGWMYLYFFYDALGVSLLAIDFPFHFFLVYSFTVVPWFLLLGIVVLVASMLVVRFVPVSVRHALDRLISHRTLFIVILSLVAFAIFVVLALVMRNVALAKTDEVRRGGVLNYVALTFKDCDNYPPRLLKAASEGGLMKLIQTKDRIFVILQPGQNDDLLGSAFSYSVALSDVSVVDVKLDRTVARAAGDSAGQ